MKVTGVKGVKSKIDTLIAKTPAFVIKTNEEFLDEINALAMKKLKAVASTKRYGKSGYPIEGSDEKITTRGGNHIKTILRYNSPHAAIVELGSTAGTVLVSAGSPYYTVGAEQGEMKGEYSVVSQFAIQRGYHYLGDAKSQMMYSFRAKNRNRYLALTNSILGV
jgi:hypothetical protein